MSAPTSPFTKLNRPQLLKIVKELTDKNRRLVDVLCTAESMALYMKGRNEVLRDLKYWVVVHAPTKSSEDVISALLSNDWQKDIYNDHP